MIKKYLVFNLLYALIFILVLYSVYAEWPMLGYILKPCIPISLLAFLLINTRLRGRFHQRLFTGLVVALTGGSLFMLRNYDPSYFTFGLVSFLLCHLFYISSFYLDFLSAKELDKKGARITIFISAIVFIGSYLYFRPHLGALKLPVLGYIIVLALLTMMAGFRNLRVNTGSFLMILSGVGCIIIAAFIFGYAYFIKPFYPSEILTLGFYMLAQYLIIVGAVERRLVHTQTPV
jgi:uncharacterized membrane protein YhhN